MLMMMIDDFGANANFTPFENPFPQFADFLEGDINLPQTVAADFGHNFGSTRWDRSLMDKTLSLGAMGQSASKQYLWAADMLSAFHDGNDNGIDADGTNSPDLPSSPNFDPNNDIFYGGNNADGFIGQILTAESINKTKFILTQLAYDGTTLGMVDPTSYNPINGIKYFPHKIAVTETAVGTGLPPKWDTFTVVDNMSKIFDQWSYLMATTSYMDMMAMHYNTTENTFIDGAMLSGAGMPMMDGMVKSLNAGYVLVTLKQFIPQFVGTSLETMAMNALNAQASYIITNLKDPNGGYYNMYTIGSGVDTTMPKTLTSNAAIIRGLYAAYDATGNTTYLSEANAAYNYLITNFYVLSNHTFKTELGNDTATYTPQNLGVLAGVLREANLSGNQGNAKDIYAAVFEIVYNKMILTEAEASGETGGDSDGDGIPYITGGTKPFVFAAEATYDTTASVSNIELGIENINVYPNPANSMVVLTILLNKQNMTIAVVDIQGRLIYKTSNIMFQGNQTVTFPLTNIDSGVYFVKIKADNKIVATEKLIKL